MKNRGLILAVVALGLLLGGVGLLLLREPQASAAELDRFVAEAPPTTTSQLDPVAALDPQPPAESRRATDVQPAREPLEDGDSDVIEDAFANGAVLVEVRVMTPDEDAPLSPHPYAGGIVHTQSWDEYSEATQAHQAPIDSDGIARFHFPGAVHLDWFRAETPRSAGFAPAFEEFHEDIPGGAVFRAAIRTQTGARVFGRVATLSGAALGGVEVAAYFESDGQHDDWSDDWYPGHFTTVSDAGGAFEFAALPIGSIMLCVRPGEWLQVCPNYDDSYFDLEEGAPHDAGVLMLARRAELVVKVVDSALRPAKLASVRLEPIAFDAPGLITEREWERRHAPQQLREDEELVLDDAQLAERIEAIEREAQTTPIWREDAASWVTDEEGALRGHTIAGRWELVVCPALGDERDEIRRDIRTPCPPLVLTLPTALVDIAGVVLDEVTHAPAPQIGVEIRSGAQNRYAGTDSDGRFGFDSVLVTGPYTLLAHGSGYFQTSAEFATTELAPVLTLHPAAQLAVRVRDVNESVVRPGIVRLVAARLDPDVARDSRALAWLARPELSLASTGVSRTGAVNFSQLWSGEYDLTYSVLVPTGGVGDWGEPLQSPQVLGAWTLHTGPKSQEVFVDLVGVPELDPIRYVSLGATVLDAETDEPIPDVELEIVHPLRTRSFSGDQGTFRMDIPAGVVSFTVRHPQYETLEESTVPLERRPVTFEWKLRRRQR